MSHILGDLCIFTYGGCKGRQERRPESHLRDGQQGRDGGPPWGEVGARGKKGGRQGWEGAEPLGMGRNSGGREASRVDPNPHGVKGEDGGREASRVDPDPHGVKGGRGGPKASGLEENPGRGRQGVRGGVKSSADDSTSHEEEGGGLNRPRTTRPPT